MGGGSEKLCFRIFIGSVYYSDHSSRASEIAKAMVWRMVFTLVQLGLDLQELLATGVGR